MQRPEIDTSSAIRVVSMMGSDPTFAPSASDISLLLEFAKQERPLPCSNIGIVIRSIAEGGEALAAKYICQTTTYPIEAYINARRAGYGRIRAFFTLVTAAIYR